MSQDHHRHQSIFEKSALSAMNHQEQQIRGDNSGLIGIEGDESGGQRVYETAGMLSEMFNFHPPATAAAELLEPRLSTDWYGERLVQCHNPISAINGNSATAMQLFLMNPQPRSSPSSLQGTSGQFSWLPDSSHGGIARSSSHGLSLSLSSSLQQLEASKVDEFRKGDAGNLLYYNHGGFDSSLSIVNVLRNSKYAKATQELLEEFCSVGRGQIKKSKLGRNNSDIGGVNPAIPGAGGCSSSSKDHPPLSGTDRIEHQRKKVKLLSMLDEVDRRYNQYCEQMQMVMNSFDVVMGFGAATPYTVLAKKAMSQHFRCLRDGITAEMRRSCEVLGEKEGGRGLGITKGETPRLKMLEHRLRQQRGFSQIGMIEQEAWRPQRGLPERSVNILRSWLFEHFLHPYPSDADKHLLARQTGLSRNQVSNWFINARVRLWKPMVEDMYQQEAKEDDEEEEEEEDDEEEGGKEREETKKPNNGVNQTMPTGKRSNINTYENYNSINATQPFSETRASQLTPTTIAEGVELPCLPATMNDLHDYGISSDDGDVGSTLIRFGTTSGDVSLTLGLRHASNMPDKISPFTIRDFGGC